MKKISIVVPVYNVEKYLNKCLDSLINQNNDDYEIIAINDGSTDNSEDILKEYKRKYKDLFKYYNKSNGGLSSARNMGLEKASGKYLLFVDSDDYINSNTINSLIKKIEKTNADIIEFNIDSIIDNEKHSLLAFDNKIEDPIKRYFVGLPSACNKLIKRSIFINNNIRFKEGIYYEDLMCMPFLIKYTTNISFDNNSYYNYVSRENSIINNKIFKNKMLSIFDIVNELYVTFAKDYYEEVEYIFIEHLLRCSGVRFLDYQKYEYIDMIVNCLKQKFPKWQNNKYYKNFPLKQKVMCYLLFKKKYKLINKLR